MDSKDKKWERVGTTKYLLSDHGDVMNAKSGRTLAKRNIKGRHAYTLRIAGESKVFFAHTLVAIVFMDFHPKDKTKVIKHKDGDYTNNHVDNLEIITCRYRNSHNNRKRTSKYPGVCWDNTAKKWMASIRIKDKSKFLGHYKRESKAAEAYTKAVIALENNIPS